MAAYLPLDRLADSLEDCSTSPTGRACRRGRTEPFCNPARRQRGFFVTFPHGVVCREVGNDTNHEDRRNHMRTNLVRDIQTVLVGAMAWIAIPSKTCAAEIRVPADHATIQAAVNAASNGDIIHIASGVYTGQVEVVSKTLTLVGQPGTVLRATTNLNSFAGSVNAPIMEIRSSQVTVRGLTFEGERLAGRFVGPGDLLGIYLRSSSGRVENCAFYGFRESTPGPEDASAIAVAAIHSNVLSR